MHVAILVIFSFIFVTFLICAGVVWNSAKTPDHNGVFGVTLPPEEQNRPEVKKVEARFGKLCLKWGIILTLTFVPVPALLEAVPNRIALSAVYLMAWAVASMYCINRPFRIVRRVLLEIKRKNGWCFGAMHETAVDTKASLLKNRSALPAWLFLPAAVIPAILLLTAHGPFRVGIIIAAFSDIALKGVFFRCYLTAKRLKTKVWSENSEINVAVNCERQRVWSQFWVITAYWDSVACVTGFMLYGLSGSGPYWLTAVLVLSGFAELALIVGTNSAFRRFRERILAADETPVLTDDDDYWKDSWFAGSVYCNPNDSSTMVEKRVGDGTTPNVATKKGWAFCYGGMIFAALLIAGLSAFFLISDFSTTALRIDSASHTVSIDTAFYGTKFPEASIKSVTLIDSIPKSSRTNGSDDGYTAVGHFTVDGYGPSLLYVHENRPPYIVVRLSDKYIFYNEQTREQTEAVYRRLQTTARR